MTMEVGGKEERKKKEKKEMENVSFFLDVFLGFACIMGGNERKRVIL